VSDQLHAPAALPFGKEPTVSTEQEADLAPEPVKITRAIEKNLTLPGTKLQKGRSWVSHRGGPGSNPGLVMWDFMMDKSGAVGGFLRELRFLQPIYIPSASPQSSSLSPEAVTIGQEWPQLQ
jgi:hypothetical protein